MKLQRQSEKNKPFTIAFNFVPKKIELNVVHKVSNLFNAVWECRSEQGEKERKRERVNKGKIKKEEGEKVKVKREKKESGIEDTGFDRLTFTRKSFQNG